jgi:ABC-type branched-subunit amino acid transport system ATPase component
MVILEGKKITKRFAGLLAVGHVDFRLQKGEILELVGLADQMNKGADQLSVASRKRLEMAKAMAMEPEMALFDEVMAGLNFGEIDQAVELIKRIRAGGMSILIIDHVKAINQQGTSVLLVEQDVQPALDNSHYGYVLSTGRVEMEGNFQELLRNREIKEIYLGV